MVDELTLEERWKRFVKDWNDQFKNEVSTMKGTMVFGGIATSFSYNIQHPYNDNYVGQVLLLHVTDNLSKDFIKRVKTKLNEHRIQFIECQIVRPVELNRYRYMHGMYITTLTDYLDRVVSHAIQLSDELKSFVSYLIKRIEMQ